MFKCQFSKPHKDEHITIMFKVRFVEHIVNFKQTSFDIPLTSLWRPFDVPLMSLWRSFDVPLTSPWRLPPIDVPMTSLLHPFDFHYVFGQNIPISRYQSQFNYSFCKQLSCLHFLGLGTNDKFCIIILPIKVNWSK